MIILDTHTWVWWVASPEQISEPARAAIEQAMDRNEVYISPIRCWEVALLVLASGAGIPEPHHRGGSEDQKR